MRLASVLLLAACLAIGFQALPTASGIAVFLDDRLPTSHLMSAINLAQSEIDPNITVTHYYVNANFSANKALADSLAATTHFALDATKGTFMSFHLEAAKIPFSVISPVVPPMGPDNFIQLPMSERLYARAALQTLKYFNVSRAGIIFASGNDTFDFYVEPVSLVAAIKSENRDFAINFPLVRPIDARESLDVIVRDSWNLKLSTIVVIGNAQQFHDVAQVAIGTQIDFNLIWLAPFTLKRSGRFQEIIASSAIPHLKHFQIIQTPTVADWQLPNLGFDPVLENCSNAFVLYDAIRLIASAIPFTSKEELEAKISSSNLSLTTGLWTFDSLGRRSGTFRISNYHATNGTHGTFETIGLVDTDGVFNVSGSPTFQLSRNATSSDTFPNYLPYFLASSFTGGTIQQVIAASDAAEAIIAQDGLLPAGYQLKRFHIETKNTAGNVILEFDSFHNKIKPFLVVGPFRSQLVQSLQTVFSVLDVPHIGPLATSIRLSDPSIGPTFFRPTPNDYETVIALTTLMKRFKLVHMAVVTSADDYGEGVDDMLARQESLVVLQRHSFSSNNAEQLRNALISIRDGGVRVVFLVCGPDVFPTALKVASELQMMSPEYVWILGDQVFFVEPDFPTGVFALDKSFGFGDANDRFLRELTLARNSSHEVAASFAAGVPFPGLGYVHDSLIMAAKAARRVIDAGYDVYNATAMKMELEAVDFQGATGRITLQGADRVGGRVSFFNMQGKEWKEFGFYDVQDTAAVFNESRSVVFLGGSTNIPQDLLIYFIQWDSGVGLAFALFTALLMLCILGTLAIIIRFRRNSLIRASSPFFLGIVLIGILIGLASIFTEVGEPSRTTCTLRMWLLVIGFALSYGSLFMKNWRIFKLYTDSSMKIIRITNGYLAIRVVAIVAAYIIYLGVWTGLDPLQSFFKPSIYYCSCNSSLWLIFQGVLVLAFLLAGVGLAIKTRNIPQLYNECRYIGLCTYNMTFCLLAGVMTSFFLSSISVDAGFVTYCAGVLFAFGGMWGILFGPKLWLVVLHPDRIKGISSSGTSNGTAMTGTSHGNASTTSSWESGNAGSIKRGGSSIVKQSTNKDSSESATGTAS